MSGSSVQGCQRHVGLLAGYVHAAALHASFFGEQVSVFILTCVLHLNQVSTFSRFPISSYINVGDTCPPPPPPPPPP